MHGTLSWFDTFSRDNSLSWQAGLYHTVNLLIFNTAVGLLHSQFNEVVLPITGWSVLSLALLAFVLPSISSAPFSSAGQQAVGFFIIYGLIILAAALKHALPMPHMLLLAVVAVTAWMAPARLEMSMLAVCLAILLVVAFLMLPIIL